MCFWAKKVKTFMRVNWIWLFSLYFFLLWSLKRFPTVNQTHTCNNSEDSWTELTLQCLIIPVLKEEQTIFTLFILKRVKQMNNLFPLQVFYDRYISLTVFKKNNMGKKYKKHNIFVVYCLNFVLHNFKMTTVFN